MRRLASGQTEGQTAQRSVYYEEEGGLMPTLPKRPCPVFGCSAMGRCPRHQPDRPRLVVAQQAHDERRGSSTQRGYGYAWQQFRKQYLASHPLCVRCGRPGRDVDHRIPRRLGGGDDESNLQTLCGSCHKSKTAKERAILQRKGLI